MRTDLDHLPARQQRELARVVAILLEEFDRAIAGGTQSFRKTGKILKIVLFGSYARQDWVDEPHNGYQSDFDLLVIVSHEKLTDIADYWYVAEDKILRDRTIGRTVNLIVHTMKDVNDALSQGQYFFSDIVRDGVELYALPGHQFVEAKPPTPQLAFLQASNHAAQKHADLDLWIVDAARHLAEADAGVQHRRRAAFHLHQAVETAYACFLLVTTLYFPRSHNIKFLRALAEQADARLIEAWPRSGKNDRRRFELLKRAYVEARYSPNFEISIADLEALSKSVERLRAIIEAVCQERLKVLAASVGP